MQKFVALAMLVVFAALIIGCERPPSSDAIQQQQQEVMLKEATSQVGMPSIVNYRERKLLKTILEMRDQEGLVTYTYVFNELKGEMVFLGKSIGYGIPYATQFTNPQKPLQTYRDGRIAHDASIIAQADPNGLFSPGSAEGTWVLLVNPNDDKDVRPVYVEPRIIVSPFPLK